MTLNPAAIALRVLAALVAPLAIARAQEQPNIDELLRSVGERVAEFYSRASRVICIETSTVQGIDSSYSPQGFARTVESELRVEFDGGETAGDASIIRKVRKVNGRAPRDEDKKRREGCTDPNPLSTEPLSFLLPQGRSEYRFTAAGTTRERNRTATMIDFISVNRKSNPVLIQDPAGRDDCFDWNGHIVSKGRVWIDAGTHDVLRVERGTPGPVNVRVPELIQRRYHLENWVVIVRDDVSIRYNTYAFSDPVEALLLPESITSVTMIRGGLQSTRRSQTFSNYQRFVTGGRVLQAGQD